MNANWTAVALYTVALAFALGVIIVFSLVLIFRDRRRNDPADVELPGAFRSVDGSGNVRVIGKADPS